MSAAAGNGRAVALVDARHRPADSGLRAGARSARSARSARAASRPDAAGCQRRTRPVATRPPAPATACQRASLVEAVDGRQRPGTARDACWRWPPRCVGHRSRRRARRHRSLEWQEEWQEMEGNWCGQRSGRHRAAYAWPTCPDSCVESTPSSLSAAPYRSSAGVSNRICGVAVTVNHALAAISPSSWPAPQPE